MSKRLKQLTYAPDSYNHLVELAEDYEKHNGEDEFFEEMREALIQLGESIEELTVEASELEIEELNL
jgi:Zn-dependent M32 family carboxypeptidase